MNSPDAQDVRPPRPFGSAQGRRFGARTYLIGALIIFVIPGLVGGAVWWLNAKKAEAEACFTNPLRKFEGHTSHVTSAAISPDGKRAVSGSYDKTIRVWDLEGGKEIARGHGRTQFILY